MQFKYGKFITKILILLYFLSLTSCSSLEAKLDKVNNVAYIPVYPGCETIPIENNIALKQCLTRKLHTYVIKTWFKIS